jgi:tape measure domain-containing protein
MADPKIRFDIQAATSGDGDVNRLATSLERLDGAIDPALAGEAQKLAAQLREVGQQQAAIDRFVELKNRSQSTAAALDQAQAAAQALARELAASDNPTRAQTGRLEKLKDTVNAAKAAHQQTVVALQAERGALAAVGIDTAKLQVSQAALAQQTGQLSQAAQRVGQRYNEQADAAAAAAAKQATANTTVRGGLEQIAGQLRSLQALAGAAIGGQLLGGLAGQVSETADQYNNLAARVRLATAGGADFDKTFQGVFEVAQRTGTSVESTGTLFTRLAQAGKDAGLSSAAAAQQALSLTETINQAIQVSGGSVQSADAAVTQLIQGLQSGVLRGEEFNSVMEQAPRLARALADGLGVTTGELRKQAEAGKLTADVVIGALQGQAQVVQGEFSKLPATVGRAINTLSTSWTQYVGEVDKANGISTKAAELIDLVARNLDTLGAALYAVGKATVAYQALRLAQTFLAINTEARAAAASVAAVGAQTAAAGAAGATAAVGIGRMASLLAGLKTFTLIGILTNLQSIGTWLGEGVAKWQGYGKAIEEAGIRARAEAEITRLAAAEKAAYAQKLQIASDASLGLNKASKAMVAEFDGVIARGEPLSAALDKISKGLQLGDLTGIANAGAALDALAQKGKLTGDQVRAALAAGLSGQDLVTFQIQAQAAFDGSEQGARRLAAALDAVTNEALRRAGSSAEELGTGFSKAATSAINDVDALVASLAKLGTTGDEAARLLGKSLDQALAAANTERAVQAVEARYKSLGEQGLITGDQLASGLEKARAKVDQLKPGISSLEEALAQFGLKSKAQLQATADAMSAAWQKIKNDTTVALADKIKAFEQYAAAAIAANGGVEKGEIALQRQILQTEAAAAGLSTTLTSGMANALAAVNKVTKGLQDMQTKANGINLPKSPFTDDPARGAITGSYDLSGLATLNQKNAAGTLKASDLTLAEAAFATALQNLRAMQVGDKTFQSPEYQRSTQRDYNQAKDLLDKVRNLQGSGTDGGTTGQSVNSTVNIVINGRSTAINVASVNDAQALENLIKQLADQANRTNP